MQVVDGVGAQGQLRKDDQVCALFARNDALGFFQPFAELNPRVFATRFESANAAKPDVLSAAAREAGLRAEIVADAEAGVRAALQTSDRPPHILICGGLHFAGEVLALSPETWPT